MIEFFETRMYFAKGWLRFKPCGQTGGHIRVYVDFYMQPAHKIIVIIW